MNELILYEIQNMFQSKTIVKNKAINLNKFFYFFYLRLIALGAILYGCSTKRLH